MPSRFLFVLIFLLCGASTHAADDEASWSKPVNGLRGRLLVYPSADERSPFCRICVELQNVGNGVLKVSFSPDKVAFQVADQAGQTMPAPGIGNYDGISPTWKESLLIPFEGTLRFRISFPGAGYHSTDKSIIDIGPRAVWVIPQDGGQFFLSGVLKITPKTRFEASTHVPWNGTLEFPPVLIPKAK